jgi:hypothetical protein
LTLKVQWILHPRVERNSHAILSLFRQTQSRT